MIFIKLHGSFTDLNTVHATATNIYALINKNVRSVTLTHTHNHAPDVTSITTVKSYT